MILKRNEKIERIDRKKIFGKNERKNNFLSEGGEGGKKGQKSVFFCASREKFIFFVLFILCIFSFFF
ncbi:unnamed protein product [Meloidogyne enterolobii]|uniref:Uncharacterized protein n=1 Tax=Meloidogyne enterolobii TaxID=390850 RepID=A0ACB0YRP3_MELEN